MEVPEDAPKIKDGFYIHYMRSLKGGVYMREEKPYSIVKGTAEAYRWRVIPAPSMGMRNHLFFKE